MPSSLTPTRPGGRAAGWPGGWPVELEDAVDAWHSVRKAIREAAVTALKAAMPLLQDTPPPCGCHETRLKCHPSSGSEIAVLLDEDSASTIDISGLRSSQIGAAFDADSGIGWFPGSEGRPLNEATGQFSHTDDLTLADYEITLRRGDTGSAHISGLPLPNAAHFLMVLNAQLTAHEAAS